MDSLGRILGGITLFLGEQKGGGSVVTENPKGEMTKNFGRIQRGDHSNLLGMKTWGREGITLAK